MDEKKLAAIFNECMRRYTEEPDKFGSDWVTVKKFLAEQTEGKEPSYGQACAAYLNKIAADLGLTV